MLRILPCNFANKDQRPEYFPVLGSFFGTLFFVTRIAWCKNETRIPGPRTSGLWDRYPGSGTSLKV